MNKRFVFDYDDTLARNRHDYDIAKIEFQKFIIEELGHHAPDCSTILKLEEDIDTENVGKLGFSMKRFPTSLKEAYQHLRNEAGLERDKGGEQKAYQIGMLAFDPDRHYKNGLIEGVAETLDFLVDKKDELILVTKGDPEIQKRKIEATGIKKWFGEKTHIIESKNPEGKYKGKNRIFIVPTKSIEIINHIIQPDYFQKTYFVGNGLKSDVVPAIDAGFKAIYIPCETWKFEKDHKLHDYKNHHNNTTIKTIKQIINIYDKL